MCEPVMVANPLTAADPTPDTKRPTMAPRRLNYDCTTVPSRLFSINQTDGKKEELNNKLYLN
jgi:hypothetical protein